MKRWLDNIIDAFDREDDDSPSESSVRDYLRWFNAVLDDFALLYRDAADECAKLDAGVLGEPPEMMYGIMRELLRGTLLKLFVEVARADGEWHEVEHRMLRSLLARVWKEPVAPQDMARAFEKIEQQSDRLEWERLLLPFCTIEELADRRADVETLIMRFTHLVAKADGHLDDAERAKLREILFVVRDELYEKPAQQSSSSANEVEAAVVAATGTKLKEQADTLRTVRGGKPTDDDDEPTPAPLPDTEQREKMLAAAQEKLNSLIGLEEVKEQIDRLIDFIKLQEYRAAHDLPTTDISLHCVFCGNPGTGKTTVARLFGEILGGLGVLNRGQLIETDRSGLVAEYAGQTGPKSHKVIDTALDGVLFIDEAYTLASEKAEDAFGQEAVQILLKRMEDDRDRLIVVAAGYPGPMEKMISINPGMRSRFQRTITFNDYSPEELEKIFLLMCDRDHYVLTVAAQQKLAAILADAYANRDEEFGNGRFVRNLFEDAVSRLASRVVDVLPVTKELLTTFEAEDIVGPNA